VSADTDVTEGFGALLRGYRMRRGLTQRELADLSAVSVRAIRDLESGRVDHPRTSTVEMLAAALRLGEQASHTFMARAVDLPGGSAPAAAEIIGSPPRPAGPVGLPGPPTVLSGIIGRRPEVSLILDCLAGEQRLISVTGVSGVGKTRLCLEVAREVAESGDRTVWWVGEELPDGALRPDDADARVPRTVAELARCDPADLREIMQRKPVVMFVDGLHAWSGHLDWLPRLLSADPRTSLVITSRGPIRVPGAWVVPLEPLTLPEPAAEPGSRGPGETASERLLLERIRRVRPTLRFDGEDQRALADICRALDGIPTALEQAAFACMAQSVQMVVRQVTSDPFALPVLPPELGHSVNLRQMLQRSLGALEESAQHLLGRLGMIEGSWSLSEAAAQLPTVPDDFVAEIHELKEHGMLRSWETGAAPRFRVLHPVRALAGPLLP
jgi:transcriptional regulator with XRE-family HTH domain